MTQQQFREATDVNRIVRHFHKTGLDPYEERKTNQKFGFATSLDFAEAMRQCAEVESAFHDLPSGERQRLGNDPAAWLEELSQAPTPDMEISEPAPAEPEIAQNAQENSPPESNEGAGH